MTETITLDGVEYASIRVLAERFGIPQDTLTMRVLSHNLTAEPAKAIRKHESKARGLRYPSRSGMRITGPRPAETYVKRTVFYAIADVREHATRVKKGGPGR